jgi:streptogramin lyase
MIFLILIILILNPISQETFTNQPPYEQINDYIKEIEIPTKNSGLAGLTIDENNNVWFVEVNASKIGVLFTNNFTIKEFSFKIDRTAKPGIEFIALSQIKYDKIRRSLWFTWSPSDSIAKFDLNSLSFEFYSIDEKDSGVFDLLIDNEGNIWVTLLYGNKIVKFYPDIKKFEKYLIPDPTGGPAILTMDNYKNIWGTLAFGRKIFKLNLEKLKPNTSEGVEIFDNFSYKNVESYFPRNFYKPASI